MKGDTDMRKLKISGYAYTLPKRTVEFDGCTRYRMSDDETLLDLAVKSCKNALKKAEMAINDIDCIVYAGAVGFQPIPCSAAILHEQIAKGTSIPATDICTTCTSFVSAMDIMSYLIDAGRYKNILIVSGDGASVGLNPEQEESYKLFSDVSTAFIISATEEERGIIHSSQYTFSEGAHDTEIRGGLNLLPPNTYSDERKADYLFDMNGVQILRFCAKKLPALFKNFINEIKELGYNGYESITAVIPHQASRALPMMMKKVGVPDEKYADRVDEYGNMVSASIPFMLAKYLDEDLLKDSDTVMLCGTAAGLTCNFMLLKL